MVLFRGINSPVPVISSPSTDTQQSDIEINLKNNPPCLHYHHCSLITLLTTRIVALSYQLYFIATICKGAWTMPNCGAD